jgi:hypothetical protein
MKYLPASSGLHHKSIIRGTRSRSMDDEEMEFSRIARGTGKGSHTRDDATSKCPPVDGPHVLVGDISFKVVPGGFEVWYSNRVVNDFPDLVDESADWLVS